MFFILQKSSIRHAMSHSKNYTPHLVPVNPILSHTNTHTYLAVTIVHSSNMLIVVFKSVNNTEHIAMHFNCSCENKYSKNAYCYTAGTLYMYSYTVCIMYSVECIFQLVSDYCSIDWHFNPFLLLVLVSSFFESPLCTDTLIPFMCSIHLYLSLLIIYINGTVSAKIAPRLKCYKNALRLNCYNFPMDNATDFLFSTLHSEMV